MYYIILAICLVLILHILFFHKKRKTQQNIEKTEEIVIDSSDSKGEDAAEPEKAEPEKKESDMEESESSEKEETENKETLEKEETNSESESFADEDGKKDVTKAVKDAFEAGISELEDAADVMDEKITKKTDEAIENAKEKIEKVKADLKDESEKIDSDVDEAVSDAKEAIEKIKSGSILDKVADALKEVKDVLTETNVTELEPTMENAEKIKDAFVSIDVETTGIGAKDNNITGMAAVKFIDGELVSSYACQIKGFAGEGEEEKEDAVEIREGLKGFLKFIKADGVETYPIVTHFSKFAMTFITKELTENKLPANISYLDIRKLSKQINPDFENHKLNTLSEYYKIPDHNGNDAVSDSKAIGQIFLAMIEKNEAE